MLVRELITDARTGEVVERMVERPDVVTADTQAAADAQAKQAADASRANETTIGDMLDAALASNAAFLVLASPTNAQTLAQVKALTRQQNGLIRLLRRKLDATS